MKKTKTIRKRRTWYEQAWSKVELVNTNPELEPYLNADKFPDYQAKAVSKLIGQGLSLTPLKELKTMTPQKLGLVLGQQCATAYHLGEHCKRLADPIAVKQTKASVAVLRKNRHVPGVSSVLHSARIAGMMLQEYAKDFPRFEKHLHATFKAALDQPSYQEAVEFFGGFAKGLTNPALKNGNLVRSTAATTLQMKMFFHTEHAAEMKNVDEWRAFLLKNGETEETLGDPERLKKFCSRLGYAPGKKKKNSRKKK